MNSPTILIVDDEPDIRTLLALTVRKLGIEAICAGDLSSAKQALGEHTFKFCITDMKLPDGNGIDLIAHIQESHPDLPVAMITAFGSIDIAIDAMKAGAFDFLTKPVDIERLRTLISNALRLEQTHVDLVYPDQAQLLGNTPPIVSVRQQIVKLARSQAPVYISGESGSGKELVARMIHANGPRGEKPFVPVNCGAIPGELMESEFFGHKKGSFTGALGDKQGLFQAANGGTLFLDEVADLSVPMQVKLLRAIQEKSVRPVGSETETSVDVRILSATHRNLAELVEAEQFRSDLFYRINVIELRVPPLRERVEDIPLLARFCVERLAVEYGLPVPRLPDETLAALRAYAFPGNVRELENILERAFTLCEDNQIRVADLRLPKNADAASAAMELSAAPEYDPAEKPLESYLEKIERDAILAALEHERWNRTAAAKRLGMSFRSLRYRLKKLGIE